MRVKILGSSTLLLLLGLAASNASAQVLLEPIISGLSAPLGIVHAADGSDRLFLVEQGGRIKVFDGATVRATPFLNIRALLPPTCPPQCGERGLLGLAFHPAYASNGFFFVNYTDASGSTVVARYRVSAGDPNVADPGSARVVLTVSQPFPNHNGGHLAFGPDGYLYIGLGDGGDGGDPFNHSQNPQSLLGKMLRIDPSTAPSCGGGGEPPCYAIPASNPFAGSPTHRPEIWALGLRNPWRYSFDRKKGDLFIGDVGQNCWEEVNFQPRASPGGENYGWRVMEGRRCYDVAGGSCSFTGCVQAGLTKPILNYRHEGTPCDAVTGGFRYRGRQVSALKARYVFADYCSGKIWTAVPSGDGTWARTLLVDTNYSISTFGENEAGELYLADIAAGTIYQFRAFPSFFDTFDDGEAADWTVVDGAWSVVGEALTNAAAPVATVLAPAASCLICTVDAELVADTAQAKVSVLAWYQDASNFVELRLVPTNGVLVLRQVVAGVMVGRVAVPQTLGVGITYRVTLSYDGAQFVVFLDGDTSPVATLAAALAPMSGAVGFQVTGVAGAPAQGALTEIHIE